MRKLKKWILDESNHRDSNTFLMTVVAHGNSQGQLAFANDDGSWNTEDFIGDLSEVDSLVGKPKILLLETCRGGKFF